MWELLAILLIGGALAMVIMQIRRGRRSQLGADALPGTLLITGVSPRPQGATGGQLVTITGAINGPGVAEFITYRQIVRDVNAWPRIGELIPVYYPAKNPDRWEAVAPHPEPPAPEPPPRGYEPPAQ